MKNKNKCSGKRKPKKSENSSAKILALLLFFLVFTVSSIASEVSAEPSIIGLIAFKGKIDFNDPNNFANIESLPTPHSFIDGNVYTMLLLYSGSFSNSVISNQSNDSIVQNYSDGSNTYSFYWTPYKSGDRKLAFDTTEIVTYNPIFSNLSVTKKISSTSEMEDLLNSKSNASLNLGQNHTLIKIDNWDLSGSVFDAYDIDINTSISFNFVNLNITKLLTGVNFNMTFIKGQNFPEYNNNSLQISGKFRDLIGAIITYYGFSFSTSDLNNDNTYWNELFDYFNINKPYNKTFYISKNKNDYSFLTEEGYGKITPTLRQDIIDSFASKAQGLTPIGLLTTAINISDVSQSLSLGNYNTTAYPTSIPFTGSYNPADYSLSATSEIPVEPAFTNGTYIAVIKAYDHFGNKAIKLLKYTIDYPNEYSMGVSSNGILYFTNPSLNVTLRGISGLPARELFFVSQDFNNTPPSGVFPLSNEISKNTFKYFTISPNETLPLGNYNLTFALNSTTLLIAETNISDIRLFVYEPLNSNWTILNTSYLGIDNGYNLFESVIPHFSTFAISEANITSAILIPVNHAPIAQNISMQVMQDNNISITFNASDEDNNTLSYLIISSPLHGTLSAISGNDNSTTYSPNAGYYGMDSFSYFADDGNLTSNTAYVFINVTQKPFVNAAPVATNFSYITNEDTPLTTTMHATDVDGDALTYNIIISPSHGTLSVISGNQVTYTPNLNYNGADSYTFQAYDGTNYSNAAINSITINAVNDPPVANAGGPYSIVEGTILIFNASLSSDPDSDPLQYRWDVNSDGIYESSWSSSPYFTYTYIYNGTYLVTVEVNDTSGLTSTSNAAVNVFDNPPIVQIIANSTSGYEPLSVAFTEMITNGNSPFNYS